MGKRVGNGRGRWRNSLRTYSWGRFGRRKTEEADLREGVELERLQWWSAGEGRFPLIRPGMISAGVWERLRDAYRDD